MFHFRHSHRNQVGGLSAGAARISAPGYTNHYGLTAQPTPGAMAYAYESLALVPYPPSGPSVATRTPIRPTSKPMYVMQSVPLAGYGGIVAGQMITQPLFNPYGGYSGFAPPAMSFMPPNIVDPSQMNGML